MRPELKGFAPGLAPTLAVLVFAALFVRLGVWQWQRGARAPGGVDALRARRRPGARARPARGHERTPVPARRGERRARRRAPVPARQPLATTAAPGYEVLTPLKRAGGAAPLLVDRGWVPFTGTRAQLPDVALAAAGLRDAHRPARRAAEPRARERPRRPGRRGHVAEAHQLPDARAAGPGVRRAAGAAHPAARSAGALRLRARLAAAGHGAAAALRLRHPVVVLRRSGARHLGGAGRAPRAARGHERERRGSLRARNLRTLAALAALFLLPLLLAFFTYYGTDWRPARQRQPRHAHHARRGRCRPCRSRALRSPARRTPAGAPALFDGQWSLVYVGDGSCEAACRARAGPHAPDAPGAQHRHDARARACSW